MANFVTVAYGLVTRETSTSGDLPVVTVSDDPWIDVSALNPRPVVGDHYDGVDFTLDHDSVTVAQGNKIAELRDFCADHIKNLGFLFSTTLGEDVDPVPYVFPSQLKDQSNIHVLAAAGMALESTYPTWTGSLWCGIGTTDNRVADATNWDMRELTIPRIKDLASALWSHIHDAQEELMMECLACCAATTVAAIDAITWQRPNS